MPELPEVEVTRQSLQTVEGATVVGARLGKPLRWPLGCATRTLAGRQLGPVLRRGNRLSILPLTDDGAERILALLGETL